MGTQPVLRAGIIGAGAIAHACHLPGYAAAPEMALAAAADPSPARRRELRQAYPELKTYASHEDMLAKEDLDVVSVCSPNALHAAQTIDALQAGCHVLCEKPMATSLRDADRMIAAAKRARRTLMVGFTHRLYRGPRRCREILARGELGKPFMIRVRFAHEGPYPGWARSKWFYEPELAGGGALLDMGIHAIDLCLWLMGPVAAVRAVTKTLFKRIAVDDNAVAVLEFANGALGYVEVGWTSKPGFAGFEIYGTEGSLICNYLAGLQMISGKASAGTDSHADWRTLDKSPATGGWSIEIAHWADVLCGREELAMGGRAGRDALAVALAAYRSSTSGRRITLA